MPAHEDAPALKPRLLLITPTYPDTSHNGLAMRAGMWVEALSKRYRVALVVVPLFATASPAAEAFARAHCDSVTVVPVTPARRSRWRGLHLRGAPPPDLIRVFAAQSRACLDAVRSLEGFGDIEVIHAFRLYNAALALTLAARLPGAHLQLDLDDIESVTRARLASLYRSLGRIDEADAEEEDARRFAAAERDLIPRFERVYVCSALDAARLRDLIPDLPEVSVVPNAVRVPPAPPARRTTRPFTLLFVGTLGYEPNLDAIRWFGWRILPRICARADRPVIFRIVGRLPLADVSDLARLEAVRFAGEVPDVTPEYGDADVVVVPLRAGGGTRIKVLEAFAHHRPVVSTSLGVEGIEADPGRDLLVADDAETFSDACLRLITDPSLGAGLAASAAGIVRDRYSQDAVDRLITDAT
jgi:glycosyltransferase involved in cell wall biosynthesis